MKFIRPELRVETPQGFSAGGHLATSVAIVKKKLVDPKLTGGTPTDAIGLLVADPVGDELALAEASLSAKINRASKIYLGVYIKALGNATLFSVRIEFKDPDRSKNIWIPSLENSPGTPARNADIDAHTTGFTDTGNYIIETRNEPMYFHVFRVVFWASGADDATTEIYLSFFPDGKEGLIPDDA